MAEPRKTARQRTMEATGKTSKVEAAKMIPRTITILGHTVVLDPFAMTIGEKQKWRGFLVDLGQHADEADHMMALAIVAIQRVDPSLTWEDAKEQVTWQVMLDAIAGAVEADPNLPEGSGVNSA